MVWRGSWARPAGPLMVVMFPVHPPAAGALLAPAAGAVVAGVLEDELVELAHADRARATAASPAAPNIFRIRILLFAVLMVSHRDHVPARRSVHVQFNWFGLWDDRDHACSMPGRGGAPGREQAPRSVRHHCPLSIARRPPFTILSPSHGILSEWGHAGAGPPPRWPACA